MKYGYEFADASQKAKAKSQKQKPKKQSMATSVADKKTYLGAISRRTLMMCC